MKKRIAYLGLSYPLLYDYKNQAEPTENDMFDSPNPIIDSPLGLMILYDELWFLCKSLCPDNMRTLPYVHFVDQEYPNFDFASITSYLESNIISIDSFQKISYGDAIKRMNIIREEYGLDNHTHSLQIGKAKCAGYNTEYTFLFDVLVWMGLRDQCSDEIELVANSSITIDVPVSSNELAGLTEHIVINGIPNYLSVNGPYHACMEELRENQYITDFRKWILAEHNHIQRHEIEEVSEAIVNTAEEKSHKVFDRYLNEHNGWNTFQSTAKTVFVTGAGILTPAISIVDAIAGIKANLEIANKAKNDRWAGFVLASRDITSKNL